MKILLATDGSRDAMEACALVARLPCREREHVILMSVVPVPSPVGATEMYPTLADLSDAYRQHSDEDLAAAMRLFEGFPGTVESVQSVGHVPSEILNTADDRRADLIVLGARGHGTFARLLLGSVSDSVATHTDASVLVVRPTGLRSRSEHELRITIAVDGSKASDGVVDQFRKFAWGPGVEVQVVSIVPGTQLFQRELAVDARDHVARLHEEAERWVAQAAEKVRDVAPRVTTAVLGGDHVGQGIVDAAADHRSDLILVGDTGRGGFRRFLLGSSSRYVLRHAECSVAIVRG